MVLAGSRELADSGSGGRVNKQARSPSVVVTVSRQERFDG